MLLTHCLYFPDVPDPPEDLRLSENQNRSVRLSWKAGANHNSPVNGRKDFSSIILRCLAWWHIVVVWRNKPRSQPSLIGFTVTVNECKFISILAIYKLFIQTLPFFLLFCFFSSPESIIEFEENRWEPGRWQELTRTPGNDTTALLSLAPYVNYQFRVVSVNAVGRSQPSKPSLRYATPPAGERCPLVLPGMKNYSVLLDLAVPSCASERREEVKATRAAFPAWGQPRQAEARGLRCLAGGFQPGYLWLC